MTLDDLIAGVPAYQTGDEKPESRRRKFERDKDELRRFGIPIQTVKDEHGEPKLYRLPPRDFYLPYLSLRLDGRASKPRRVGKYGYGALPTLSFEPEELEAIAHAAARVRELGDPLLAEHAESAVRKLAVDLPMDATRADETGVAPGAVAGRRGDVRGAEQGAPRPEAGHLPLSLDGERRGRPPHRRAVRALLPQPALVPGRPRAG